MASKLLCRQLGVVLYSGNYSLARSIRLQQKVLPHGSRLIQCGQLPFCTSSTLTTDVEGVDVRYVNGLPVVSLPLPSRQEKCQFILKPISNTLGDLCNFIQEEDGGVDRVAAYNPDGVRLAKSTPIDALLRSDFELEINSKRYSVGPVQEDMMLSSEHSIDVSSVKNQIAQLYTTLHIEEFQQERERELQAKLENLKLELLPLEAVKKELEEKAVKRTTFLQWVGLGMMGLQFGVLARLTWWEYSWDIMEPVTYFVTYGTSIAMFAYYVTTKQDYAFPAVRDREFLLTLHKHAKKRKLDVERYNHICTKISQTEYDLERLRDPLQLQLPIQTILPKKE